MVICSLKVKQLFIYCIFLKNLSKVTVDFANWNDWDDKKSEGRVALSWVNKLDVRHVYEQSLFIDSNN